MGASAPAHLFVTVESIFWALRTPAQKPTLYVGLRQRAGQKPRYSEHISLEYFKIATR